MFPFVSFRFLICSLILFPLLKVLRHKVCARYTRRLVDPQDIPLHVYIVLSSVCFDNLNLHEMIRDV
jgi:hypothetical protein